MNPVEEDLLRVQEFMNKHFHIKAGYLGNFVSLEKGNVHNMLRPLLVLLSAGMFGKISNKVISLAAVVQYIYVAFCVHKGVFEEKDLEYNVVESVDSKEGFQYPVLAGDYLCGCFFSSLCKAGMAEYLRPLSEILCEINQGSIIKLTNEHVVANASRDLEVARKESAALLAGCCVLSGTLMGAEKRQQELLTQFGMNLGIGLGLLEQGYEVKQIKMYGEKAQQAWKEFPEGSCKTALGELLISVMGSQISCKRLVC